MIGGSKLISPDLPITKSTEDTLNKGAFAKTIAQYFFRLYSRLAYMENGVVEKHHGTRYYRR